ncbi:MAG: bifunctional DNA-binding transcriptional regulator/O6-methylguanine-DNA methyltransferase Ada [Planctomycetota bacterium]
MTGKPLVQHDARWRAVLARDAAADGTFVFAVRTTRIYCRPSCGARRARPENVEFHADGAAAQRAGFRACKRCRPDAASSTQRQAELVAALCRRLEAAHAPLRLRDLAAHAGMSPFHVQRLFKAVVGVTPRAYSEALRRRRLHAALGSRRSVTAAQHAAGYESSGHFYADTGPGLGMTPRGYRAGGLGERIQFAIGECSLGAVLVAATARGVAAILIGSDANELAHDLERRFPKAELVGGDAAFERVVAEVTGFVDGARTGFDLPLDIRGTVFQQRVWQVLRDVSAGQRVSYAEVAARLGAPRAARAVARACAANSHAVVIPCHRVVRTNGDVSGYRFGVDRKRALLAREQVRRT